MQGGRLGCGTSGKMKKAIKCPTCKKEGDWLSGGYGPFCSHRCKLIDLGKWLGEEHAVSTPLQPEHLGEYAELPPGEHLDRPEQK